MEWSRKLLIFIGFVFWGALGYSQMDENKYLVYFTDKDNSPFSIYEPEAYLSQRAIQRRQNQGIEIDEYDLPVNPDYIQTVAAIDEIEVLASLKWFNAVLVKTENPEVLEELELISVVDRWEVSRWFTREIPADYEKITYPKSDDLYGPSLNQIQMLNGLFLHENGFRGEGMYIGVLDAGYKSMQGKPVFDSLFNDNRILAKYNFVDDNDEIFQHSSHGTSVLSTMAGYLPNKLIGTAPKASYFLGITEAADIESRVEEVYWVMGAEYADSLGVDIINTSLGYSNFDDEEENYTYSDMDGNTTLITRASNRAASRGILMVTSAGNQGNKDWYYITAPADADSVLTVGAVNPDGEVASFSSRGPTSDGRVKPNVMAQGRNAVVTNLGDTVMHSNGTSFSSPIMAGMSACLWQSVPQATAMEVFKSIEMSAHLFEIPNDSMGYGIPNFEIARSVLIQLVGVENIIAQENPSSLKFYPNPFSAGIIQTQNLEKVTFPAEMAVIDAAGKILFSGALSSVFELENRLSKSLNTAAPGVYVVIIQDFNKHIYSDKIIRY